MRSIFFCSAIILAALLASSSSLVSADVVTFENANDVEKKVVLGENIWFVQFTKSDNCAEAGCEAFKAAAKALEGSVSFGTVSEPQTAEKYEISKFPSYKIWTPAADTKTKDGAFSDYTEATVDAAKFIEVLTAATNDLVTRRLPKKEQEEKKAGDTTFDNTEVITITDDNYEELILNGNDAWLIAATASWCMHCKNLVPHWKEAAAAGTGVKVANINADGNNKFATKYGVQGFPTIKFFKPNEPDQTPEDYNAGRTAKDIIAYLEEKAEKYGKGTPTVVSQAKDQAQLEKECLNKDKLLCVVFVVQHVAFTGAAGRNEQLEMFGKVASKFKSRSAAFLWISGGDHEKFENFFAIEGNYPTVIAMNQEKKKFSVFTGQFAKDPIAQYLDKILGGRQSMSIAKEAFAPLSKNVDLWDGKDYVEDSDE